MSAPKIANPDVVENFMLAVKSGNHIEVAAAFAGISQRTVLRWLNRGSREVLRATAEADKAEREKLRFKADEKVYAAFFQQVEQALAHPEVALSTAVTKKGMGGDWMAAMTMLERRFPSTLDSQRECTCEWSRWWAYTDNGLST